MILINRESLKKLLREGLDRKIISHKELVYAFCQVVKTVLHLIPESEKALPKISIETAERWCKGEATLEEVKQASLDAYDAYDADAAYCAASIVAVSANYAAKYHIATSNAIVATDVDAIYAEKQIEMENLLLSHLPRLNKLKLFL